MLNENTKLLWVSNSLSEQIHLMILNGFSMNDREQSQLCLFYLYFQLFIFIFIVF